MTHCTKYLRMFTLRQPQLLTVIITQCHTFSITSNIRNTTSPLYTLILLVYVFDINSCDVRYMYIYSPIILSVFLVKPIFLLNPQVTSEIMHAARRMGVHA